MDKTNEFTDENPRIQKYLSECGAMSRRAAEKAVAEGRVLVNNIPAVIGQKVSPNALVTVDGKLITPKEKNVYLVLNKPAGYVTTLSDEKDRRCVAELIADVGTRVYPVGRLDYESEGLLLFTNDGAMANKLMHPGHELPKIYHVRVEGELENKKIAELAKPMTIDGYRIQPVGVELMSREDGRTTLKMTLYEGRNRQIRKMCENCGLEVRKLRRVALGELTLSGIRPGKWRLLTPPEIAYLKKASEQVRKPVTEAEAESDD